MQWGVNRRVQSIQLWGDEWKWKAVHLRDWHSHSGKQYARNISRAEKTSAASFNQEVLLLRTYFLLLHCSHRARARCLPQHCIFTFKQHLVWVSCRHAAKCLRLLSLSEKQVMHQIHNREMSKHTSLYPIFYSHPKSTENIY